MSQEKKRSPAGESSTGASGDGEIVYHKAPSFLWVIVPIALLMAYGYFSR